MAWISWVFCCFGVFVIRSPMNGFQSIFNWFWLGSLCILNGIFVDFNTFPIDLGWVSIAFSMEFEWISIRVQLILDGVWWVSISFSMDFEWLGWVSIAFSMGWIDFDTCSIDFGWVSMGFHFIFNGFWMVCDAFSIAFGLFCNGLSYVFYWATLCFRMGPLNSSIAFSLVFPTPWQHPNA